MKTIPTDLKGAKELQTDLTSNISLHLTFSFKEYLEYDRYFIDWYGKGNGSLHSV